MLKEERHNIIITEIKAHSRVYSTELSKLLHVSEDTVRRDLHELARSGQVRKVHGGAMVNTKYEWPEINGHRSSPAEYMTIASKASHQVLPDAVVLLDGADINLLIIDCLPRDLSATIFTNSLQVASKLFEFPYTETILLGGRLSNKHRITTGMDVIHSLSEIHADLCLMEISSIHDEVGLSEDDKEVANTKKAMIRASSKVTALCTSNHIGTKQPFRVCPLPTVHTVITEVDPSNHIMDGLTSKGVQVF